MANESDFYIEALVYNAHIMRRLIECRMISKNRASVSQLVNKMGYGYGSDKKTTGTELEIRNLVGLRLRPTEEDGSWKPLALEMAKALETEPDELWPGALKSQVPASASRVLEGMVGKSVEWLVMANKN